MKKYAWLFIVLLSACSSSNDEPPYEINTKQFHQKLDEQGNKVFAYVVSVKANSRKSLNSNRPLTRSEFKSFAEHEYFEESSSLKLQLEDEAVRLLQSELEERDYCGNNYEINEVLWRELSVQLRGECL
ncbi:MAG: hypothetical protein ACTH7Q_09855 [Pseudoalteromonas sp.]|uniref:hypothetical protein n=1 Tax=unclassified Pseudoalteromonas TaxID=194690 RepID=UPI003F9548A4